MNAFPFMRFSTELTDHSGWTVLSIKFYPNSKEKIKLLFQKTNLNINDLRFKVYFC